MSKASPRGVSSKWVLNIMDKIFESDPFPLSQIRFAYWFFCFFSFQAGNDDSEDSDSRDEEEEEDEMDAIDANQTPNTNSAATIDTSSPDIFN